MFEQSLSVDQTVSLKSKKSRDGMIDQPREGMIEQSYDGMIYQS